jgi:hypothetical protein
MGFFVLNMSKEDKFSPRCTKHKLSYYRTLNYYIISRYTELGRKTYSYTVLMWSLPIEIGFVGES